MSLISPNPKIRTWKFTCVNASINLTFASLVSITTWSIRSRVSSRSCVQGMAVLLLWTWLLTSSKIYRQTSKRITKRFTSSTSPPKTLTSGSVRGRTVKASSRKQMRPWWSATSVNMNSVPSVCWQCIRGNATMKRWSSLRGICIIGNARSASSSFKKIRAATTSPANAVLSSVTSVGRTGLRYIMAIMMKMEEYCLYPILESRFSTMRIQTAVTVTVVTGSVVDVSAAIVNVAIIAVGSTSAAVRLVGLWSNCQLSSSYSVCSSPWWWWYS